MIQYVIKYSMDTLCMISFLFLKTSTACVCICLENGEKICIRLLAALTPGIMELGVGEQMGECHILIYILFGVWFFNYHILFS